MIIGITGGIGSGKSTIAHALAGHGFVVYDCDREAKRIAAEDPGVRAAIIRLLGGEAFADGRYNTAYVARRVFGDKDLLHSLNRIIHPKVLQDIQERKGSEDLVVESAILFEAGLDELCDAVVVVDAPEEIRIARTIARDYQGKASAENINKVRARIRAQKASPTGEAQKKVLHIINDGRTSIASLARTILDQYCAAS